MNWLCNTQDDQRPQHCICTRCFWKGQVTWTAPKRTTCERWKRIPTTWPVCKYSIDVWCVCVCVDCVLDCRSMLRSCQSDAATLWRPTRSLCASRPWRAWHSYNRTALSDLINVIWTMIARNTYFFYYFKRNNLFCQQFWQIKHCLQQCCHWPRLRRTRVMTHCAVTLSQLWQTMPTIIISVFYIKRLFFLKIFLFSKMKTKFQSSLVLIFNWITSHISNISIKFNTNLIWNEKKIIMICVI